MPNNTQQQIDDLKNKIQTLTDEFYRNNFSSSQDFQKKSRFNSGLRVPTLSTTPATCEVGEVCCVSGKLRVCSAVNTWTIVGTQS
jgi:hypothetical protein